jgi:hypothetical protein
MTIFHNKKQIRISKKQSPFTMFYQLVSYLWPSQGIQTSTHCFGMTLTGVNAPSSEQPHHKPINLSKNSTTNQEGEGINYAYIPRAFPQFPTITITT